MKRTRLLNNNEIRRVSNCFDGIFEIRTMTERPKYNGC